MGFNKSELTKVAQLARLQVTESEIEDVSERISEILRLIDQMQSINTACIAPMSHPFDGTQVLRSDVITEQNRRDELQTLAPSVEKGLFLVPKVLE